MNKYYAQNHLFSAHVLWSYDISDLMSDKTRHCRHCKYNPYSHDVQTNIALKQLANNNPHHHNQEPYYLQIRHKFHLPIFEKKIL